MARHRSLTLHFNDGARLQRALESRQLALAVDGKLPVIPVSAAPAPERLPDSVIRGASVSA